MTQPAYAAAEPVPQRRRPRWPWIAAVLAALLAGGALVWFLVLRDDGPSVITSGAELNKPVRDGRFVFTVTAVRCGVTEVGDELLDVEPEGRFCLVDIAVKNGASTARNFDTTAQKAYDADGNEYSTDMQAEVFANGDARTFLDQVNPGGQVKGTLVFDVPEDTTLTAVVLHESLSTAGARITVR